MTDEALLIPMMALAIPIVVAPVAIVTKYVRDRREMLHKERMKALKLGRVLPGSEASYAKAAMVVGGIMPVGVFFCAWMASMASDHHSTDAWMTAMLTSIVGVIGGVKLAGRGLALRKNDSTTLASHSNGVAKPPFNPDAYDAIAHRG